MSDVLTEITFFIIYRFIQLGVWLLLCVAITAIVAGFSSNKKLIRWIIKIAVAITVCIIIWMLVDDLSYIIKHRFMWFGIWLALCFAVTTVTVVVQLINKKLRKKRPIHWAIKLTGYVAFYTISLFAIMKLLGSYPGNWLSIDREYRGLVYELYNQELCCHGYEGVYGGFSGEFVISFKENRNRERTMVQRDYIVLKTAVEEYMEVNESFRGKRIILAFSAISQAPVCSIYSFNPETGEMGTDVPCWFVEGIYANNCTELAEIYHDFSGISGGVGTLDDMQELTNIRNLTYLELYVADMDKEDRDLEEQRLEELNTLLPDCEIHLNQN